jgi:hypothetical protein
MSTSTPTYTLCPGPGYCVWTRDGSGNWTAASYCDPGCECYDPTGMSTNNLVSTASTDSSGKPIKIYHPRGKTAQFTIDDDTIFTRIGTYKLHHSKAKCEFHRGGVLNTGAEPKTKPYTYASGDQYITQCYM